MVGKGGGKEEEKGGGGGGGGYGNFFKTMEALSLYRLISSRIVIKDMMIERRKGR